MKPALSVVIPTYNRVEKLVECLRCLEDQTLDKKFYEVWVVDDGSTDNTPEFLEKWKNSEKGHYVLNQKNQGQGMARNNALEHVLGESVLFIGDDIYASKKFLETHHQFHIQNPQKNRACLGLTEWDPTKLITPFMEWMTQGGYQFDYESLREGRKTDFWHFYTSNLSVKTALLKTNRFSKEFKGYGWEDIELAYRLEKEDHLELIYTPKALAVHDHYLDQKDLEKKMQSLARNAKIFEKLHPELKVIPRGLKWLIFKILSSTPFLRTLQIVGKVFKGKTQNLYWYALSKRYFLSAI